jgi:hypothetical protein
MNVLKLSFARFLSFVTKSIFRRKPKEAMIFDEIDSNALRLRRKKIRSNPSPKVSVFFLVSLVAKSKTRDWSITCTHLYRTIDSILQQSDPNFEIIICGHDKPSAIPSDSRITFITYQPEQFPSTWEIEPGTGDKGAKRAQSIALLEGSRDCDGYLFGVDADDIFHPDLVSYVRNSNNGRGYILEKGYKVDIASRNVEELGARAIFARGKTPLWSACGSGFMCYFDLRPESAIGMELAHTATLTNHRRSPIVAALSGFWPERIPFHAGVYLINHGANITDHKIADAKNSCSRSISSDPLSEIEKEFKIEMSQSRSPLGRSRV